MAPKRRSSSNRQSKAQQSTLAFHSTSNRVTKPKTRTASGKNVLAEAVKKEVEEKEEEEGEDGHTTGDAAIIEQADRAQEQVESAPEEEEARKITGKRIETYWKMESQSLAARAHQKDLSVEEKILRKFDISGQYGPCTGIARVKRWKRAHRLGLEPPIEVLAVLVKEQKGQDKDKDKLAVQKSYVDELLNSRDEDGV